MRVYVSQGTLSESIIVCRQSHTREYRRPDPDLGKLDEGLYAYSYDGSPGWLKTTSGEINFVLPESNADWIHTNRRAAHWISKDLFRDCRSQWSAESTSAPYKRPRDPVLGSSVQFVLLI